MELDWLGAFPLQEFDDVCFSWHAMWTGDKREWERRRVADTTSRRLEGVLGGLGTRVLPASHHAPRASNHARTAEAMCGTAGGVS